MSVGVGFERDPEHRDLVRSTLIDDRVLATLVNLWLILARDSLGIQRGLPICLILRSSSADILSLRPCPLLSSSHSLFFYLRRPSSSPLEASQPPL